MKSKAYQFFIESDDATKAEAYDKSLEAAQADQIKIMSEKKRDTILIIIFVPVILIGLSFLVHLPELVELIYDHFVTDPALVSDLKPL